jgi:hypothetical protein
MLPIRWTQSPCMNIDVNAVRNQPSPAGPLGHELSTSHGWYARSRSELSNPGPLPASWTKTKKRTFATISETVTTGKCRVGTLSLSGSTVCRQRITSAISAFCECSRFSAWSQTADCGP